MNIRELHVDGFGRLSNLDLALSPGLQVLIGPNERGKSTLRAFITDMFYGQRRDLRSPAYDEGNLLRRPWENPEAYGGRLVYALDRGGVYEITRSFVRDRQHVLLRDCQTGRDITGMFPAHPNHEIGFAEAHLGLSKGVFINTATIGHLNLDGLGDEQALDRIRERLLAINDSGAGIRSAGSALHALQELLDALQRDAIAPAGEALPPLREELAAARAAVREQARLNRRRAEALARLAECETERARLERASERASARRRVARLDEIERIQEQMDAVTQQMFPLLPFRDFSTTGLSEAQHLNMLAETIRLQTERREAELRRLTPELEGLEQSTPGDAPPPAPIPEETERRLHELRAREERYEERFTEADARVRQLNDQIAVTQRRLAEVPDFSRVAADPVEWISQLANAFTLALKTRDKECADRDRLREIVRRERQRIAPDAELFKHSDSFSERLREFEDAQRDTARRKTETEALQQSLAAALEEARERIPGMFWLAAVCGVFLLVLAGVFIASGKPPVLYAGAVILLALGYFLAQFTAARGLARRLRQEHDTAKAELERLKAAEADAVPPIEVLRKRANCQSLRELEARFDGFREALARLDTFVSELEQQEIRARESEERVPKLFARIQEAFQTAGEPLEDMNAVSAAVNRVMGRYQEYRDMKRRMSDLRNQLQTAIENQREYGDALENTRRALAQVEDQIRGIMRESGCADQADLEDPLAALRAYSEHCAVRQNARGRMEMLRRQVEETLDQLESDRRELAQCAADLRRLLDGAGVDSTGDWQARAEKAREYRSLQQTHAGLSEQINLLLDGTPLAELRRIAAELGTEEGGLPEEEAERELVQVRDEIKRLQLEVNHLQVAALECTAELRPTADVREEIADRERARDRAAALRDAALRAATLIEEAANQRHARIAPVIARDASRFLRDITLGAHGDVCIGEGFTITLGPKHAGLPTVTTESLSKGALDQVYLSLRLALVRLLSASGETLPMLMDDPFANYDDQRLKSAMRVLTEIGADNQILVFTCREDVGLAAAEAGASVIEMR
ncbi:MAG TPA: AAA family ATPase [Candidatus Hydrogenedentes bacterium]|nr:AAA family ATPase [Candidatus Hydrogenedentota bacterium]